MANEEVASQADSASAPVPTPVAAGRKTTSSAIPERITGLGRRKTAVARVLLRPGAGQWSVNGRPLEQHFPRPILRQSITRPLVLTETQGQYDILVRVAGGGLTGQAEAIRLGLARALLKTDEGFRIRLRSEDLLTRDAREVERKKPGRPKARKRFQFSKR